jgi:phosphocarrier protein
MSVPAARRQVAILNPKGLHMRPATRFVKLAGTFRATVRVLGNGKSVNGKSILDMTTLAAECGTEIDIQADGPDAEDAVAALAELVLARFHMEDDGDNEAG